MLSDQTIEELNTLFRAQDSYAPSMSITDRLARKTIVMLVGATCEGKSAVMDTVASLDERFEVIGTRTTREPREGDNDRYTYYDNTDSGLKTLFDAIQKGEMVQYAVNPYAQLLYGTMLDDYRTEYNLADVFSSSVHNFRQLGFKNAIAITVVSDPEVWLARFDTRFPTGDPQRRARRDEAIESFTWSLSQDNSEHYWVENVNNNLEIAAKEVINISLGSAEGNANARRMAEASLEAAWSIVV